MTITADLDRIRLMIGDTDMENPLLSNDEIDVQITNWPHNREMAAAYCAESIAAKFSRGYDFATDNQTFNLSQKVNQYTALADTLRKRAAIYSIPIGGTITYDTWGSAL